MIEALLQYVAGCLLVIGGLFCLAAAVGLVRFPDFYSRMHPAAKAGTLGSCVALVALALVAGDAGIVTRALAGVVFFLLTAPISAHLLARAAYLSGYRMGNESKVDELAPHVRGADHASPPPTPRR